MADASNSLFLPELLIHVAEYFKPSEIVAPCRVSREWNEMFSRRIWRHIDLWKYTLDDPEDHLPRDITCMQLKTLGIIQFPESSGPEGPAQVAEYKEIWQRLVKLMEQNDNLDMI
ncbi:hypothetical protein BGZ52_007484 [Haplosporangium bisporale]|nr:hypothetical protein BGZ52_007484 [Haplosporangium bisporale]